MVKKTTEPGVIKTYLSSANLEYNKKDYAFQLELTTILDGKCNAKFSQDTINEIVLWKTNRYANLSSNALDHINSIPNTKDPHDPKITEEILDVLLNEPGVRLPMASTILRFKNPHCYQIIDQRAYRFAGFSEVPLTTTKSKVNIVRNIKTYIEYLDKLREISIKLKIDFQCLDRLFYIKDKLENSNFPIKY